MGSVRNLGDLTRGSYRPRSVKDEMRANLVRKLETGATVFPGLVVYEETVAPALINALLARHSIVLLGLRGQAKSRILRSLTSLLDPVIPVVEGCEIHDDPLAPLCRRCRDLIASQGDATPIEWLPPESRYVEKLATPDVTVADIIGDVDPIRAARGGHDLSSELTIHYGLLPRAHRGIFAINELPDLAGRIQVALFNILEEGDVQIKGYPIRLPLDVCLVFTANPEDYTARGKIVTPLKDRIGSEIRTHYPATLDLGVAITEQESWTTRDGEIYVPRFVREVVEAAAFAARRDRRVDRRSGVSQRVPIAVLELAVSNAERRALALREQPVCVRLVDVHAALPALTGKLELEYEGELAGAERIASGVLGEAVAEVFSLHLGASDLAEVVGFFEGGGSLRLREDRGAEDQLALLSRVPGLMPLVPALGVSPEAPIPLRVSAAEFVLEGLAAHKKIGRSDDRGYVAIEPEAVMGLDLEQLERLRGPRRPVN